MSIFQKILNKIRIQILTQIHSFSTMKSISYVGNDAFTSIDVEASLFKICKGGVTMTSVALDDLDVLYGYWFFYATFSPDYMID